MTEEPLVAGGRAGELFRGVLPDEGPSPLAPMTADERLEADYRDTGLTIGPHPMALRREEMREQITLAAKMFAGLVAAAIVIGWLMYPFPI